VCLCVCGFECLVKVSDISHLLSRNFVRVCMFACARERV